MQLDAKQDKAVHAESEKVLVVAPAGSGKTRVLIERINHLIENCKVSPTEILSFSFTRKSSGEIKERLEERMGPKMYGITCGTMHGLGLNMIQRFGELIGLKPGKITVYSQFESDLLTKEIAKELGIFKKSWKIPKKEIDKVFANYYERGIEPEPCDKPYDLFNTVLARCKENNALTYGSLLLGLKLLIPEIKKYMHIRHLLVDEIQDIDPLQWSIINEMVSSFDSDLFVVGDLSQSVYQFRGAVPGYILEHQDEFDIFKLENNYRSHPAIVEAANNLIRNNTERLDNTMVAARSVASNESAIDIKKETDSAGIVSLISNMPEKDNICVLARNHGLLGKISKLMTEQGIEHTYNGKKTKLTNSEDFRRFHAFLKLVVNPYDNFSFLLIRDIIGLTPIEYIDIRVEATLVGTSHFQAWMNLDTADPATWQKWINDSEHNLLDTIVARMDFEFGFDPTEIAEFIFGWLKHHPEGTIKQYLNYLALYDTQDEMHEEHEGIQLMTIHAAKGLEFKTVIIAACNEDIIPSKQAIKNLEIEQERNLFYVALTRATDLLIPTIRHEVKDVPANEFRGKPAYTVKSPVSRFIHEMMSF